MTADELPADLYDHIVRAVIAYERDGEAALVRELAAAGDHAAAVRQHVESLRSSGLLQEPEQPAAIGDYSVLQRLGSGGMGTVYLCEHPERQPRRVAVKVMRAGMDSREVLARFRLEQRAMQALDHPGIARLLDAGTTDSGRPFLVMEYVPGLQLHRYCDERQLDARDRLELFAKICDAVQHAHHKGIVHRDLKPSNVLVLDRDSKPWPVVIDFGVAKSIGGATPGATLFTLPGAMLGTPEYMSPEQATHEVDVDTRADVYSLGVMLYELLTGTLPIERERLRGGDIAKVLGHTEPPTPSTRITALGAAATSIAECRRIDVNGLRRLLRGDLDWVTMKALEKDRNRRYGMPAELAADVRRFLASEPVSAGPISSWYRLRKLCARNRAQTIATAVVLATVAGGLCTSTWFWRAAVVSSRASADSLDDALTAVGELVEVGDSDLVDVPHMAKVRRGLLERSVLFYRRFVERADAGDARLLPRIADAQLRLGCLQFHLGEHAAAVATLRDGEARVERLPANAVDLALRARALDALSDAAEHVGDAAAAVSATERAERLLRAAFAQAAEDDIRCWLMRTLVRRSYQLGGRSPEPAHACAAEAMLLGEPFLEPAGTHAARVPFVLQAGAELARRLLGLGRRDDALRELQRSFALWQRATKDSVEPSLGWRLTTAIGEVAELFARCDDYGRMIDVLAACEAAYLRLTTDHPAVLEYRSGLAQTRSRKGSAQLRNYRVREGLATTTQAEADAIAALAMAPGDPTLLHDAAHIASAVAQAHLESRVQGTPFDLDLARAARERAATLIAELAKLPNGGRTATRLRIEERRLFALLHPTPASAEAIAALVDALGCADELLASEPGSTLVRERRVELRLRYGQALRLGGEVSRARELLVTTLVEQAALQATAASREVWMLRRRALLLELAHAEAALGLAESVLERLRERVTLADNEDWGGKLEVVRLLLQFAKGPLAAHAAPLLLRAREVAQLALAAGAAYEQRGAPNSSPAMLATMRANNHALAAEVEALAGDAGAEAAALGAVAECRAEACRSGGNERSKLQLRAACDAWLVRLATLGDPALLNTAGERIAEWAAGDAEGLQSAAAVFGRFVVAHPDAAGVRAAGRRLLDLAAQAGADRAQFAQQADLRPLLDG